jgi:epoxyqueuosine reductase QueG
MINKMIDEFIRKSINSEDNYVNKEVALSKEVEGLKIFDEPIIGYASANDPMFNTLKKEGIIGKHFKLPNEWLKTGKSVVSVFFPFTERVRRGNVKVAEWPSVEWLHGRFEGQAFINNTIKKLVDMLRNEGVLAIEPAKEESFFTKGALKKGDSLSYTSNWSERHVAYVCGLGTFGLSKGLITKKGVAGRFASIVIDVDTIHTKREYNSYEEYCNLCGDCIKNCPVIAISFSEGKDHDICNGFLSEIRQKHTPRYGCGKCQVGVECENRIPLD